MPGSTVALLIGLAPIACEVTCGDGAMLFVIGLFGLAVLALGFVAVLLGLIGLILSR